MDSGPEGLESPAGHSTPETNLVTPGSTDMRISRTHPSVSYSDESPTPTSEPRPIVSALKREVFEDDGQIQHKVKKARVAFA